MSNQMPLPSTSHTKAVQLAAARAKRVGKNPRHQAEMNERKLLDFIARHGFITSKIAKFLMKDKNNRVLKRLHKRKMLVEILLVHPAYTVCFGTEGAVFILTESGLLHLQNISNSFYPYSELNPSKIKHQQVSHTCELQLALIQILQTGTGVKYVTERELGQKDVKGSKRFDAIFWTNEGDQFCLEIERTAKEGRFFCETRRRLHEALLERVDGKLKYKGAYYFLHRSIKATYQKGFAKDSPVYHWYKNNQNKYVKGNVEFNIKEHVAARIHYFDLIDLSGKGENCGD